MLIICEIYKQISYLWNLQAIFGVIFFYTNVPPTKNKKWPKKKTLRISLKK